MTPFPWLFNGEAHILFSLLTSMWISAVLLSRLTLSLQFKDSKFLKISSIFISNCLFTYLIASSHFF